MANEEQYYNPIIQAMIASAHAQQQGAQLKQQGDIAKQQEAARQQQLENETTRIENEHEYNTGMLNAHQQMTQAQLESNKVQQMAAAAELSRIGGDPNAMRQSMGMQPLNGLPSPQDYARSLQQQSQAQAQGTANVTQPFQQQMQQNEFTHQSNAAMLQNAHQDVMQQHQQDFEKQMLPLQQNYKMQESQLDRASREKIAGMDIASRQSIAMLPYNPPTGSLGTMAVAALNGAPMNPDHPTDRAVLSQMYQNNWHPVPKGDIEALKAGQSIIPLLKQMQDVRNMLPTSTVGAATQKVGQGVGGAFVKTDLQTKIDEMNTNVVNLGKTIEGLTGGRVTTAMLGLSGGGLPGIGMTQGQADDKINNIKGMFTNKYDNIILGGLPEDAKKIIYKMNGIKPTSELLGTPAGASGQVTVKAPDGSSHVFPDQASADKFKSLAGIK